LPQGQHRRSGRRRSSHVRCRVGPGLFSKEHAYILRLAAPACLDGDDEYDKVDKSDRIHVYSTDDKLLKRLRQLLGKMVRVRGSPFGEENAHHHAPIVMGISAVEPLLKR
jgi:hypothetical protein